MAMQAPTRTGFERWQDGISKAVSDAKWNSWDCEIQMAVHEYNRHLRGSSGRPMSATVIAERYNGGGDPNYARRLDYALSMVRKGKVALCAQ
ncbi:hypothetical protein F6X39_21880 [Paraburkholderia sp. UCT2]|nr:hypothetical protein [Paraburkholderia sp. UCT2]